ncbi:hypothetical protein E3N88_28879 [Mikania micrantha]|uniref:Tf2-1-like SH3-like domain-containing protein n=1 Tax=Mikania micrantha TaxID=192012 RepID=A0A5N6N119_9ASTR|nr:hypothetical protein E3N88_28879 [Mikania micrantha]
MNVKCKVVRVAIYLKLPGVTQKSYADRRRKPLEFQVGDRVLLKVSPWKGVVRFGKKGKLAPRYVGPFEILERIGPLAYKLKLPVELSNVHDTFHVSNLKRCLADHDVQIPLEDIQVQNNMQFIERPVEIMDHGVKKLKRSRIPIVKVRWEGKRGAEFTWEREDQMKLKYPQLFTSISLGKNSIVLYRNSGGTASDKAGSWTLGQTLSLSRIPIHPLSLSRNPSFERAYLARFSTELGVLGVHAKLSTFPTRKYKRSVDLSGQNRGML